MYEGHEWFSFFRESTIIGGGPSGRRFVFAGGAAAGLGRQVVALEVAGRVATRKDLTWKIILGKVDVNK